MKFVDKKIVQTLFSLVLIFVLFVRYFSKSMSMARVFYAQNSIWTAICQMLLRAKYTQLRWFTTRVIAIMSMLINAWCEILKYWSLEQKCNIQPIWLVLSTNKKKITVSVGEVSLTHEEQMAEVWKFKSVHF